MANRSDFSSGLPRRYKRMLALTSSGDPEQDAIVRKLFIQAHRHVQDVNSGRIAKPDVLPKVSEPESN